jgi:tRNA A37 N6-isopentenylltransferase MiaA
VTKAGLTARNVWFNKFTNSDLQNLVGAKHALQSRYLNILQFGNISCIVGGNSLYFSTLAGHSSKLVKIQDKQIVHSCFTQTTLSKIV